MSSGGEVGGCGYGCVLHGSCLGGFGGGFYWLLVCTRYQVYLNTYSSPFWLVYGSRAGTTAWSLEGEWDRGRGEVGEAVIYPNIVSPILWDNYKER